MNMEISKPLGLNVGNTETIDEVNHEKKQPTSHNSSKGLTEGIIDNVSKKSLRVDDGESKPELNKGSIDSKGNLKTKSNYSLNEIFSLLSDFHTKEKLKVNLRGHGYNHDFISGLWSGKKEEQLSEMISSSLDIVDGYIESIADYYLSMMKEEGLLSSMPDGELKNKLTGNGVDKFKSKSEIIEFLKKEKNIETFIKNIKTATAYCTDRTKLFKPLLEELNKFPLMDDETGLKLSESKVDFSAELNSLHGMAEIQDETKNILDDVNNIYNSQRKSDIDYSQSLTVLMGRLADLRDKLAQNKLENDRLIATIQQKTMQDKVDADSAEMTKKIEKAERLQALFKWLGPLLIALMTVLTALTGGLLAKALAAVVVVVTIISEVVKATGGPDIMAKVMEPVTKLVGEIQKLIKNIAMEIGKAQGKSPEELKKLEEVMEIVSMVLAVVAVIAIFAAAGAVVGKVIGQAGSETVKEVLKHVMAEIKKLLTTIMLTSAVINSASSISQAELNADVIRKQATLNFDQEFLNQITALIEQIMAVFSESQKELVSLNEKISQVGKESFQRKKSILQQGPLAV